MKMLVYILSFFFHENILQYDHLNILKISNARGW